MVSLAKEVEEPILKNAKADIKKSNKGQQELRMTRTEVLKEHDAGKRKETAVDPLT